MTVCMCSTHDNYIHTCIQTWVCDIGATSHCQHQPCIPAAVGVVRFFFRLPSLNFAPPLLPRLLSRKQQPNDQATDRSTNTTFRHFLLPIQIMYSSKIFSTLFWATVEIIQYNNNTAAILIAQLRTISTRVFTTSTEHFSACCWCFFFFFCLLFATQFFCTHMHTRYIHMYVFIIRI